MKKKNKTKDQAIVRISIENGVIRTHLLTPEEEKQFLRTHPNFKTQVLSLEDIERLAKSIPADPNAAGAAKGQ